jgi:hypothetical protein
LTPRPAIWRGLIYSTGYFDRHVNGSRIDFGGEAG